MTTLRIQLLGTPQVYVDGEVTSLERRKSLAILAYLAVTGRVLGRDSLAALFWPDSDQTRARMSLRRALSSLNQMIGHAHIEASQDAVELVSSSTLYVDVAEFRRLCADRDAVASLQQAIDLYHGDFMAGFSLTDAPDFDIWQSQQSEQLHVLLLRALQRLAQLQQAAGDHAGLADTARRWVESDPLDERAYEHLITALALLGQRSTALRQYETCAETLRAELGVEPGESLRKLHAAIQAGELMPVVADSPPVAMPATVVAPPDDAPIKVRRRHWPETNLPRQTTAFVGRTQEISTIKQLLLDTVDCQLLTLVAPGGMGKTRLALKAAEECVDAFQDGIHFVSLEGIDDVDGLHMALAGALRLSLQNGQDAGHALIESLRSAALLLVLDNCEALAGSVAWLAALTAEAPEVKILATARERLHLQNEWVFDVEGLRCPDLAPAGIGETVRKLANSWQEYSALRLFAERAQRSRLNLQLDGQVDAVLRIALLTEGSPLALELAAAWVRSMPPRAIADELEQSLALLRNQMHDRVPRHASLHVVFEQSWAFLTPDEQRTLAALSVFRGTFTRSAATTVVGATQSQLAMLVDRALLRQMADGRYALHGQIREFAVEKLADLADAGAAYVTRHRIFYASLVDSWKDAISQVNHRQALEAIGVEIDNIRAAWENAIHTADLATLYQLIRPMFVFLERHSWIREGLQRLAATIAVLEAEVAARTGGPVSGDGHDLALALSRAYSGHGYLCTILGDKSTAEASLRKALALAQHTELDAEIGWAFNYLANLAFSGSDYRLAQEHASAALAAFEEADYERGIASASDMLGLVAQYSGNFAEAEQLHRRSCSIHAAEDDVWRLATSELNLGLALQSVGRYAEAGAIHAHALAVWEEAGDRIRMAWALTNLGNCAHATGEHEEAIARFERQIALDEESGRRSGVAIGYYNLSMVFMDLDRAPDAVARLEVAAAEFAAVGHRHGEALALAWLAAAMTHAGTTAQVGDLLGDAAAIVRSLKQPAVTVGVLDAVAEVCGAAGMTAQAMRCAARVIAHPATDEFVRARLRRRSELWQAQAGSSAAATHSELDRVSMEHLLDELLATLE